MEKENVEMLTRFYTVNLVSFANRMKNLKHHYDIYSKDFSDYTALDILEDVNTQSRLTTEYTVGLEKIDEFIRYPDKWLYNRIREFNDYCNKIGNNDNARELMVYCELETNARVSSAILVSRGLGDTL
jgi:hypothetical protein